MKLPVAVSILLTSAYGSVWPYHGAVGSGSSTGGVLLGGAYSVVPTISLLPTIPLRDLSTVILGSVAGPAVLKRAPTVTETIPSERSDVSGTNVLSEKKITASAVGEDLTIVKGAVSGPVTLIAASDGTAVEASAKATATASGVGAGATITAGSVGKSGSVIVKEGGASAVADATVGVVSAKAVIGPSTGPVIVAGPTAVQAIVSPATPVASDVTGDGPTENPPTVAPKTDAPAANGPSAVTASSTAGSTSVTSGNAMAVDSGGIFKSSVSSAATITQSTASVVKTTAEANSVYAPAVAFAASKSVVSVPLSTTISGPSGSISVIGSSSAHLTGKLLRPYVHA